MHIKAPNTDTHINMHYFKKTFSKSQGKTTSWNLCKKNTHKKRSAHLGKVPFYMCCILRCTHTASSVTVQTVFLSMHTVFSAAAQLRNEGGRTASFASVSSVLRLVYWLVWLSCLTVFTCSFSTVQDDNQQSAAAQQEQAAQTWAHCLYLFTIYKECL